jgi:hypothetical protein
VFAHPHAAGRFYAWTPQDVRALFPRGVDERVGFVLLALLPLLFVPVRTRAALLVVLPLAEVLLSRMPTTYTMGSHYAGAWAGWVFYAFAAGIAAIWARDAHRAHRILYWCVGLCVAEFAAADPLHPGFFLRAPSAKDAALDRFLQTLPAGAEVATQEEAYTHLAARDPSATLLPETQSAAIGACAILTDNDFADSPRLQESGEHVLRLVRSGAYRVARRDGNITLYRKTAGCP